MNNLNIPALLRMNRAVKPEQRIKATDRVLHSALPNGTFRRERPMVKITSRALRASDTGLLNAPVPTSTSAMRNFSTEQRALLREIHSRPRSLKERLGYGELTDEEFNKDWDADPYFPSEDEQGS